VSELPALSSLTALVDDIVSSLFRGIAKIFKINAAFNCFSRGPKGPAPLGSKLDQHAALSSNTNTNNMLLTAAIDFDQSNATSS
jgi:hypothetical protein